LAAAVVQFAAAMVTRAEGHEVVDAVRAWFGWVGVVDVVHLELLGRAAHLAAVTITVERGLAGASPPGAVASASGRISRPPAIPSCAVLGARFVVDEDDAASRDRA
jgi:hypothetical protein